MIHSFLCAERLIQIEDLKRAVSNLRLRETKSSLFSFLRIGHQIEYFKSILLVKILAGLFYFYAQPDFFFNVVFVSRSKRLV